MSIEQMEYMLALELEKKISYAARQCYISQPALSQQLAKIEQELGFPLFSRINNIYIPTAKGKIMLDAFRNIVCLYRDTLCRLEQSGDLSRKVIAIGIPSQRAATLFTYLYPRFSDAFPDYELKLAEMSITSVPRMLKNQIIDFGLFSEQSSLFEEVKESFTYYPIVDEELALITAKGHPLDLKSDGNHTIKINQIDGEDMVFYEKGLIVRNLVDAYFQENHIICKNVSSFKAANIIIQFVKQSQAVSIIPRMFAINHADLAIYHLDPPITQKIGLLALDRYRNTEIAEAIIALAKEAFASI